MSVFDKEENAITLHAILYGALLYSYSSSTRSRGNGNGNGNAVASMRNWTMNYSITP